MDMRGKIALITGATGGIGMAIASALAKQGVKLVVTGRNETALQQLASATGATTVCADMTAHEDRLKILQVCKEYEVSVLIHSAGTLDFSMFEQQSGQAIEAMVNLNLLAPMELTRLLLPVLHCHQSSAIVFIGSTFGSIGHPGFTVYCATKFGLRGFSESLRRELGDTGTTVHYLAPRATSTALNDAYVEQLNQALGNTSDAPERVAKEVVHVLTRTAGTNRYLGWPEKLFVRINSLLPSLVDSAVAKKLATVRQFAPNNTEQ